MSSELKKRAREARTKKAILGSDVDVTMIPEDASEKEKWTKLEDIPQELGQKLVEVGVDVSGKERAGTYIQMGNEVSFCNYNAEGVEIMPIYEALEKYSWLKDYYWKAVEVDLDKYTAELFFSTSQQQDKNWNHTPEYFSSLLLSIRFFSSVFF